LPEAEEERIEAEVRDEVDEAARRAEARAFPDPASACTHVVARPLRPVRGVPEGVEVPAAAVDAEVPLAEAGPTTERNVVDAVRQAQHDLLAGDERVLVLGEDVGPRGGVFRATDGLAATFGPSRVLDTPLA